jgi:hypothetical protein
VGRRGERRATHLWPARRPFPNLSTPRFCHPQSCIKKIDPEDIEIDIDAIDPTTFWTVDAFIKDCLPGGKKFKKAKGSGGAGGGAAGAASSADPKAKKPKL